MINLSVAVQYLVGEIRTEFSLMRVISHYRSKILLNAVSYASILINFSSLLIGSRCYYQPHVSPVTPSWPEVILITTETQWTQNQHWFLHPVSSARQVVANQQQQKIHLLWHQFSNVIIGVLYPEFHYLASVLFGFPFRKLPQNDIPFASPCSIHAFDSV